MFERKSLSVVVAHLFPESGLPEDVLNKNPITRIAGRCSEEKRDK
jgi:hypothetical protein